MSFILIITKWQICKCGLEQREGRAASCRAPAPSKDKGRTQQLFVSKTAGEEVHYLQQLIRNTPRPYLLQNTHGRAAGKGRREAGAGLHGGGGVKLRGSYSSMSVSTSPCKQTSSAAQLPTLYSEKRMGSGQQDPPNGAAEVLRHITPPLLNTSN